ncbi:MAG TPA: LptF/LptG family permease, partial [Acidobacteriota bacterium]|nr:LptF/LptG family permease [Acidobacteriota bacterium]
MLRILDRYVIREVLPYFLLSFFLLTSIIFVHEANRFSELFVVFSQRGISSTPLLMLVISLLPSIVIFTIPISFLLSVMLAMGRLSGDSEIVVMTAGGVSPLQLLRPVMLVALIAGTITAYNTFYLLPVAVNSLNQLKQKRNQILVQSISTQIKPGMFAENLPNRVLYIEQSDRASDTWKNIFIAEQEEGEKDNKEPKIYTAQSGNLVLGEDLAQTELWLDHSFVYASEARKFAKQKDTMSTYSKRAVIRFDLSSDNDQKKPEPPAVDAVEDLDPLPPGPDLMTLPQLWRAVPEAGKERQYQIEFYKRFALPVACLFFALIGVALGITGTRSGRSSGLFIGLVVNLAFYLLFLGGERAARQGVLPVLLGVWGPDLILGAVSFWLFAGGPA